MYRDGPLNYSAQKETMMPKMIRTVLLSFQLTYVNTCNSGLFFKDIYKEGLVVGIFSKHSDLCIEGSPPKGTILTFL